MTTKYNSQKTTVDNIVFHSRKEAKRYIELKTLEKAGLISGLELQPRFVLQEKFKYKGKAIREITYVADFKYTKYNIIIVEDVKASQYYTTDVYKLKKKLLLCKYPEINFIETY